MNKTILVIAAVLIIGVAFYAYSKPADAPLKKDEDDDNAGNGLGVVNKGNKVQNNPLIPVRKPEPPQINESLSKYSRDGIGDSMSVVPNFVNKGESLKLDISATSHKDNPMKFIWVVNGVNVESGISTLLASENQNNSTYKSSITIPVNENITVEAFVDNGVSMVSAGKAVFVPREVAVTSNTVFPSIEAVFTDLPVNAKGMYSIGSSFFIEITNKLASNRFVLGQSYAEVGAIYDTDERGLLNQLTQILNQSNIGKSYVFSLGNIDRLRAQYTVLIMAKEASSNYNILSATSTSSSAETPTVNFANKVDSTNTSVQSGGVNLGGSLSNLTVSADGIKYKG